MTSTFECSKKWGDYHGRERAGEIYRKRLEEEQEK